MCGLVAVSLNKKRDSSFLKESLERIQHRGPDNQGIYKSDDECYLLGHRRLSIIDTSSLANQPIEDSSGRFVMVYNGEVYNFQELKKDFCSDFEWKDWRTSGDSEVIVEGVARYGFDFLSKLNGIFSLAIYDKKESLLFILRDPLGIKPLFYTNQNGSYYFASELNAFIGIPELKRTVDYDSLQEVLSYMYVPEPNTPFKEFKKVQPGTLWVLKNGEVIKRQSLFKHLSEKIEFGSRVEAQQMFDETFSQAVRRQLVSDVPIGMMLSGGVDSSAIAAKIYEHDHKIKEAYTISFLDTDVKNDPQTSDLPYAELIAKKFDFNLNVLTCGSDVLENLPDALNFMLDGFTDPAALSTYLISKRAHKDNIKVLLTGQGADEFLCGYRRYLAEAMLTGPYRHLFGLLGKIDINLGSGAFGRRLKRFQSLARQSEVERIHSMFSWGNAATTSKLLKGRASGRNVFSAYYENLSGTSIEKILKIDQQFDLMSLNLTYCDRMSMAQSIEARVPFLDFDLVRVMNSLPLDLKINRGISKYALKKSMEGKLPKKILYRSKAGFGLPIRSWFKNSNELIDLYLNERTVEDIGFFDSGEVSKLRKATMNGTADHSYLLFSILGLQAFLQKYA